jgi:hypothetical protein
MLDEIHKIKDTTIAARRERAKEQQILTQVNNRLSKHYQFNTYAEYRHFIEHNLRSTKKNAILKNKAYYEQQLKLMAKEDQLDKYNTLLQDFYYNNLQYIKGM